MSDIFIAYKREERPVARKLAKAFEKKGWSVWWDHKLQAGERFDNAIQKALKDVKCVIVLWSRRSINSEYVQAEAVFALNQNKLVPVAIEKIKEADLLFRFQRLHTERLVNWGGSETTPSFRKLVAAVESRISPPLAEAKEAERAAEAARKRKEAEKKRLAREAEQERKRKQEEERKRREENRQRVEREAKRKAKKVKARRAAPRKPRSKPELPKPGTVFRDTLKYGSKGPEMVVIPAGAFQMGDIQGSGVDSEKPVHEVRIAKPFAMGKYPVTFEEDDRFAKTTRRGLSDDQGWGRGKRPVIKVSWDDAVAYCKWLSEQTGKRYRLPTEAEWEYAARARTKTDYWWGKKWRPNMANCKESGSRWGREQTTPVGSFPANPFGLHDTAGNVWEWVEDCQHKNYQGAPTDGSAWLKQDDGDCARRVIRGGSWGGGPGGVRSALRNGYGPGARNNGIGFRLARDL